MSPAGLAQIYSIVEISKSTLILKGKLPGIGDVQIKYSKRKKQAPVKSAQVSKKSGTAAKDPDFKSVVAGSPLVKIAMFAGEELRYNKGLQ